ncbi:hypothetical protein B0T17DRAFT_118323 [Bombardia bombarda]|uniref:Uncharacterized protein n=1 Tax=Bombardia bombarda TaxID=252184 RepID=A0AA39TMI7_9PEZI|nr:hypothetical protein B0T17DRAFT_118323 [Bombardia bombarda]
MSSVIDTNYENIIQVYTDNVANKTSSKTNRRFYELILLLWALKQGYRGSIQFKKSTDLPHGGHQESDEQLFHNFVSRLGQICDSRKGIGGSTVTAFAVLQHPSNSEFVFASNRRKTVELETVRAYIHSILISLREASNCEDDDEREEYLANLLRDVLIFCRERVKCYLKGLMDALKSCIAICERQGSAAQTTPSGGTQTSRVVSRVTFFTELLSLAQLAISNFQDDDEFLDHTEELISALQKLQKPAMVVFINKKAGDDKSGNPEPWQELRHHSGRLLAYRRAVETLWDAGSMWPELLDAFEVTCIDSSTKSANPLPKESPQKGSEILTRMITDPSRTKYLDLLRTYDQNGCDLDKEISDEWTNKKFRPIVHAELLVLNWLETTGGTRPERFFNNWRYIGCSKPSCMVCHLYFSVHPSGVQARGTHGNLYTKCRLPDNADVFGMATEAEALNKRLEIMQAMNAHFKQNIMRLLDEKAPGGRRHDSEYLSSLGRRGPGTTLGANLGGFGAQLSQLNAQVGVGQQQQWAGSTAYTESEVGDLGVESVSSSEVSSASG